MVTHEKYRYERLPMVAEPELIKTGREKRREKRKRQRKINKVFLA